MSGNWIWEPTRDWIEQTNVWRFMRNLGFEDREAFLRYSRENTEEFWDRMVRETGIEWFRPYDRVLDTSRGVEWSEWFIGGQLNIAWNCLDRHLALENPACIWEGEDGTIRTLTFAQLAEEVNGLANGLAALGRRTAGGLSRVQNGNLHLYALLVLVGIIASLAWSWRHG